MIANVGTIDRLLRVLIGAVCIAFVFTGPFAAGGWERTALAVVGIIMILTSWIKFCPLYKVLGLKT